MHVGAKKGPFRAKLQFNSSCLLSSALYDVIGTVNAKPLRDGSLLDMCIDSKQ